MSSLLSPKTLLTIKNLSLLAKTVVDGFMSGAQKSLKKGSGMEFSQYRSYQSGDDLRQMDWKLFARSDRYFIREAETETSIQIRLVLDLSASMNHEDDGIRKIDYARFLAATLAWLAQYQGDSPGLFVLQKGNLLSLTPRRDTQHLQRLFYQLEHIHPERTFPEKEETVAVLSGSRMRELVIFISDFYENENEISQLVHQLKAKKNEVIVFHLLAPNEVWLNFSGNVTFEDWETGRTVEVAADQIRDTYTTALQLRLETIRRNMAENDIYYRLLTTDQPLDQALRDFLVQRSRM
jgi:uncharacterized protein (DUF58 family)